jgi:hypothetical protein
LEYLKGTTTLKAPNKKANKKMGYAVCGQQHLNRKITKITNEFQMQFISTALQTWTKYQDNLKTKFIFFWRGCFGDEESPLCNPIKEVVQICVSAVIKHQRK